MSENPMSSVQLVTPLALSHLKQVTKSVTHHSVSFSTTFVFFFLTIGLLCFTAVCFQLLCGCSMAACIFLSTLCSGTRRSLAAGSLRPLSVPEQPSLLMVVSFLPSLRRGAHPWLSHGAITADPACLSSCRSQFCAINCPLEGCYLEIGI